MTEKQNTSSEAENKPDTNAQDMADNSEQEGLKTYTKSKDVDSNKQDAATEPVDMSACMEQFHRTFEASARRWELVVYPSLLAFIILAAYGFYLIYKLTSDVDIIASQMGTIATSMVKVTDNMTSVTVEMRAMSGHTRFMSDEVQKQRKILDNMSSSLGSMNTHFEEMNRTVGSMSMTMYQMRADTSLMGHNLHNVSGPMRFMNNFMPW